MSRHNANYCEILFEIIAKHYTKFFKSYFLKLGSDNFGDFSPSLEPSSIKERLQGADLVVGGQASSGPGPCDSG